MSSAPRILIIDDDRELCELLVDYIGSAGFQVDTQHHPDDGIKAALGGQYVMAVLDVMLPGINGFEVLRRIRSKSNLPVLMLTARGEEIDRIVGLELGADDYLPKPFNARELIARIRAMLRRANREGSAVSPDREPPLVIDDLVIDPAARTVQCANNVVILTSTEFDLLLMLAKSAGHAVSRDDLSQRVFGRRLFPEDRNIDVHVSNLRRKLGPQPGGAERIKTMRGTGYIYVLAPRASQATESSSANG